MRVMALDVGQKRIGVAVSDPEGITAQPLATINRDGSELEVLRSLCEETGAQRLVVGLPLLMDGSEGEQARASRSFGELAGEYTGLPVAYQDERLTTREAEAVAAEARLPRRARRSASDRIAAALLLRAYLESEGD